jgi:hypothetical protein
MLKVFLSIVFKLLFPKFYTVQVEHNSQRRERRSQSRMAIHLLNSRKPYFTDDNATREQCKK